VGVVAAPIAPVTVSTIDIGPDAFVNGIALTPDGSRAYVPVSFGDAGNTVLVIDTSTNTVVGSPIPVGDFPNQVEVTPDGGRAYIVNAGDDTVSVIDTATNTVTATINVGGSGSALMSPDGSRLYVANFNVMDHSVNDVIVVDTDPASATYHTVIDTIDVNELTYGMVISGDRLYLSGFDLSVIDLNPGSPTYHTVISSTPLSGDDSVHSFEAAVSADGTRLYLTPHTFHPDQPATTEVLVLDITGAQPVPVASIPTDDAIDIALSPDGAYAFVTNPGDDNLSVIDTATNTLIATIPFEDSPRSLAFSPDGKKVYITISGDIDEPDTVAVITLG
jgi:YVTN family beta-propeller protein